MENITGVTVINSFQQLIKYGWGISFVGVILLIIFGSAGLLLLIGCGIYWKETSAIWIGIFIILFGFFFFAIACSEATPIYETEYQILVDDNVSLNDFIKHYEIVRKEGLTLIVREAK